VDDKSLRPRLVRAVLSGVAPLLLAAAVVIVDPFVASDRKVDLHSLLFTTVLCGVGAMVLIETVKRLLGVRSAFQLQLVRADLLRLAHERTAEVSRRLAVDAEDQTSANARLEGAVEYAIHEQVLVPMGLGRIDSAFNLPVEQMVPQLADVLALASLRANPDAHGVYAAELNQIAEVSGPDLTDLLFRSEVSDSRNSTRDYLDRPDVSRAAERVMSRFLEQLQIRVGNRWRHYVRASAAWVSGSLGLAVAAWAPPDVLVSSATPIAALLGGGFLAWFARDLTAAVERWRR
jgi:hypothetical protein